MEQQTKTNEKVVVVSIDVDKDGWTTYKNFDKDLVKKIKAVKKPTTFQEWSNSEPVTIDKELNDTQTLCIDKAGLYSIVNTEAITEKLDEQHLRDINSIYPPKKYFMENFGQLQLAHQKLLDVSGGAFEGNDYTSVSVRLMQCSTYEYGGAIQYTQESRGWSTAFMYFNIDGDYVIRDYNLDLKAVQGEPQTKEKARGEFLKKLNRYDELLHVEGSDIWFTKDLETCLKLEVNMSGEINLREIPKVRDGVYYQRGESRNQVKYPPKKGNVVDDSIESIKNKVKEAFENFDNRK